MAKKKIVAKPKAAPVSRKAGPETPDDMEPMQFFPGQRRKLQLVKFSPKRNAQGEFRLRFDMSMPLAGERMTKMPHPIAAAYQAVATLDNGITCSDVEGQIDPQTLDIYSTDQSSRRAVPSFAAIELRDLYVIRPGTQSKKDTTEIELRFCFTVRVSDDQLLWAKKHWGAFFWGDFEKTQGIISEQPAEKPNGKQMELSDYAGSEQQASVQEITTARPRVGKEAAVGSE